jgi:ribonuclease T
MPLNLSADGSSLVGHNAFFDLGFLRAATERSKLKSPFHQFSTIDTVSLSALYYGETVLAKAMRVANIEHANPMGNLATIKEEGLLLLKRQVVIFALFITMQVNYGLKAVLSNIPAQLLW